VPEPPKLERAMLRELDKDFQKPINADRDVTVQFNPESLKVTFANQIAQGTGTGDQRGPQARQFVGAGTTKLALALWFDVTGEGGGAMPTDVRRLTAKVAYFITPEKLPPSSAGGAGSGAGGAGAGGGGGAPAPTFAPPAVRFLWGTFQFDGIMESLEETLEFWSPDGRPLRASVTLGLSAQKITFAFSDKSASSASRGPAAGATPGTRPLTQAGAGVSLPGLAASVGAGGSWQSIAAANGIEDPLRLSAGTFIDLSARARVGS
jgi:hypothetical protein